MAEKDFEYNIRKIDVRHGIVAVDLIGGIFASSVGDFSGVFDVVRDMRARDVILNFKELDFISSSGIGLLMKLNNEFDKSHTRLWIVEVSSEMARIFSQLSLDELFRFFPAEEEVVNEIQELGPPS